MNQKDGFAGGFFTGVILGGVVGGVVGALAASKRSNGDEETSPQRFNLRQNPQLSTEEGIETARLSLEDKIAQLNMAIDDVRQQLGAVNGTQPEQE
jgi:gas vesicle protein